MSLTGTRKDPFLSPDSPPLNNISRVQALISLPFSPRSLCLFLNLLDFLLNFSLLVTRGEGWRRGVSGKKKSPA